jgi:hypothetical protein
MTAATTNITTASSEIAYLLDVLHHDAFHFVQIAFHLDGRETRNE